MADDGTLSKVSRHWIAEAFASPDPLLGHFMRRIGELHVFYHTMVFSGS